MSSTLSTADTGEITAGATVELSDAEWQRRLKPAQYHVLRRRRCL